MIVSKLYLVLGEKNYPAYTGDSTIEIVRVLVPADCEDKAMEEAKKRVNNVLGITLLYEVEEGLGLDANQVWRAHDGLDNEKVYLI